MSQNGQKIWKKWLQTTDSRIEWRKIVHFAANFLAPIIVKGINWDGSWCGNWSLWMCVSTFSRQSGRSNHCRMLGNNDACWSRWLRRRNSANYWDHKVHRVQVCCAVSWIHMIVVGVVVVVVVVGVGWGGGGGGGGVQVCCAVSWVHVIVSYDHKFTVLNVFIKFYKIEKKQHEIMRNTFSLSLIIWKTAIETWAHEMNGGPGNELGGPGELNSSSSSRSRSRSRSRRRRRRRRRRQNSALHNFVLLQLIITKFGDWLCPQRPLLGCQF